MVRGKPFKRDLNRLVKAGVIPKPIWMDIVSATRPAFEPVRSTQTKKIVYPEDRLRSKYLLRNPEARRVPVNLKAKRIEDRHISDRFVHTQLRLMREKNISEDMAYKEALDIINLKTIDHSEVLDSDLTGPLTNANVSDKTAQVYLASVRDANRDKKLFEELHSQTSSESS